MLKSLARTKITNLFIIMMFLSINIFSNTSSLKTSLEVTQKNMSIFPESDEWIGDPMPYYDGSTFKIFFLDDLRSYRGNGFHPWSLINTKDFTTYKYEGIVIPHSTDINSPESALGTGSVIKDKNGLYHAFYTGHNGNLYPKEIIMHATSEDMLKWNKLPEHSFAANSQYDKNDFRDPFVFYNEDEKQYWMLITTRKSNTGVIAKYTSKDLLNWEDKGVFFKNDMGTNSNLECPSLIKYGNFWYLAFSDQWPDRVVHYRIFNPSTGKFTRPKQDNWDGNGFYAGRLEKDNENLYVFGWVPTRFNYEDNEKFDWGGNLVVHKLKQLENGELYPIVNENISNKIITEINPNPISKTNSTKLDSNSIGFNGEKFDFIEFDKIIGINKIQGTIKLNSNQGKIGFMFGMDNNKQGKVNILLDSQSNTITTYNVPTNKIEKSNYESIINYDFKDNSEIKYTIFIDKSVLTFYLNDKVVLSTRIFNMQKKNWGIFSIENNAEISNLKMYK